MDFQSDSLSTAKAAPPERSVTTYLTWVVTALIVLVAVLIVLTFLRAPQAPRTAAERDLAKFELLVAEKPRDPKAQAGMGAALAQVGSYKEAVKFFQTSLKLKKDPEVYVALADAYHRMGSKGEALANARKAQKMSDKYVGGWFVEGRIHYETGDYKKAVKPLFKSMEIDPGASDIHYLLGNSFEKLGMKKAAVDEYQAAIKYLPDYQEPLDGLKRLGVKPIKSSAVEGAH